MRLVIVANLGTTMNLDKIAHVQMTGSYFGGEGCQKLETDWLVA